MRRRWMNSCIVVMVAFWGSGCGLFDADEVIPEYTAEIEIHHYPYTDEDKISATEDDGDCDIWIRWHEATFNYDSNVPPRYNIDIFCHGRVTIRSQIPADDTFEGISPQTPVRETAIWYPNESTEIPSEDLSVRGRHVLMPSEWVERCLPSRNNPVDNGLPGLLTIHAFNFDEEVQRASIHATFQFWHPKDCMRGEIELDIKSRDAK